MGDYGFVCLGKNDTFWYYAVSYGYLISEYPEYFAEQASYMSEEEIALYDALTADSPRLLADAEVLPLTLEEIFISETEVLGYDFKNIIQ